MYPLGIKPTADKAIRTAYGLRLSEFHKQHQTPIWNDEETIELRTRFSVRDDMEALLSASLTEDLIEELTEILLGTLYPTYDKRKHA